ncbi:hypothetical protein T06_16312, partial [Trichinella sp. T6]
MLTRTDQRRATYFHFRQKFKIGRDTSDGEFVTLLKHNLDNKAEHRYCATKREMLNLLWALREFYPYLYGGLFLESRPQPVAYAASEIVKSQRDGTHDGMQMHYLGRIVNNAGSTELRQIRYLHHFAPINHMPRQKSREFKWKSDTKTSIRCGNSVAKEFNVKQKLVPILSRKRFLCFVEHLPRPFWREKTAGLSKKPLLLTWP